MVCLARLVAEICNFLLLVAFIAVAGDVLCSTSRSGNREMRSGVDRWALGLVFLLGFFSTTGLST